MPHPTQPRRPTPPESTTLTYCSGPPLLPPTPRQRLLQTTCRLQCLSITHTVSKTTVLRRQVHLARLNRTLDLLQDSLARLHYLPHLPKTSSLRLEGQASRDLTSSRTIVSQTPSPKRRDHRVNPNSLSNHSSRRRCSKLRMDRNHPRVRLLLCSNLRLNCLRSLVVPLVQDNSRSSNNNSRSNPSSSHRSLVTNHFNHNTNNRLRRCNSRNSPINSNSNRLKERIPSRIWLGYSSHPQLVVCLGLED